ncbi:MAG: hypothetical protein INR64_15865 [Caulobacteraceae bacterium]|nr:hypothetical protein [Caulobacter sp.]
MTQERPAEHAPPESVGSRADTTDAAPPHPPEALRSLRQAMRRARYDDAERVGAMADLRVARLGRLELLEEALEPLLAQIPEDVDLFDVGLMPGAHPRLFVDMIGFVEMSRDARTYRLVQDTRHGRKTIAQSDSVARMVDAVTDYVARRLVERDKALAADAEEAHPPPSGPPAMEARLPEPAPRRRRGLLGIAGAAFGFLITLLGVITFFTGLFALLFYGALQLWPKLVELWPGLSGQG